MWQTRADTFCNAASYSKIDQHLALKNIIESIIDQYMMFNFIYNS